jgi:hypothetical protein
MALLSAKAETAYLALARVAAQIGAENYKRYLAEPAYRRPKQFPITEAHRDVCDAMLDVMAGRITVDEAFALIHRYDVEAQRWPDDEA